MPKSSVLLQRITSPTHQTTTHNNHYTTATTKQPSTATSQTTFEIPDDVVQYHTQPISPTQCSSAVIQQIHAPVQTVWSIIRRFDAPQIYKHFIRSCDVISGNGTDVGTLRRVRVVSGLPAAVSDERLEILDDDRHVISFSVVGGDHRLSNYRSVTSLHVDEVDEDKTVVLESYVVDTPVGNTNDETCVFVDTIVRCNLQSLALIAENLVKKGNDNRSD